ncbi:MAG: hypothetical protein AMXMBFR82_15310 [Candidatus Hydrogenedentota bacterium]
MSGIRGLTNAIGNLSTRFVDSAVLFAANEANVFSLLDSPTDAETVAAQLRWPVRTTRMLLDGLVAIDLLVKSGSQYLNTELAATCLVPGRPHYQGHIIQHNANSASLWLRLGDSLRTGNPVRETGEDRSPEELRAFILGMSDIGRLSARELLDAVDISTRTNLLDVGGGPGTYALTFLDAVPGMRATIFDRPAVLDIAREQAEAAGMLNRLSFHPGDLTTDSLGEGYDLVLVSNIIHSYSEQTNRNLISNCFEALVPGGMLIVKDFLTHNDRSGPAFSLLFALRMQIANGEGDTYSCEQVASWTDDAGFDGGRLINLSPQTRLWIVCKP